MCCISDDTCSPNRPSYPVPGRRVQDEAASRHVHLGRWQARHLSSSLAGTGAQEIEAGDASSPSRTPVERSMPRARPGMSGWDLFQDFEKPASQPVAMDRLVGSASGLAHVSQLHQRHPLPGLIPLPVGSVPVPVYCRYKLHPGGRPQEMGWLRRGAAVAARGPTVMSVHCSVRTRANVADVFSCWKKAAASRSCPHRKLFPIGAVPLAGAKIFKCLGSTE